MKVQEIYAFLDSRFPFSAALPYDNPGLLVGDGNEEVRGILVCLDCTAEAIGEAVKKGANLIVTHHPIIFEPLKSVTADGLVYRLIRNGISLISVHTNYDAGDGGVNDCLCAAVGLKNVHKVLDSEGFAYRIGDTEAPMTAEALAARFGERLGVRVRYVENGRKLQRIAVCSGSGGSMLAEVMQTGADAFLTSDVKHDVFMEAHTAGFALFDAGHFNTEDVAVEPLCGVLREAVPDIPVIGFHFSPIRWM